MNLNTINQPKDYSEYIIAGAKVSNEQQTRGKRSYANKTTHDIFVNFLTKISE